MKVLKGILLCLVALIVLILVIAAVLPKTFHVEREIVVQAPKDRVFEYLKYVKNQDNFAVWNQMDPNMKKEYRGTDGTVGFVAAWESENPDVGKGEQEITNIVEGERIDFALRFLEPFESSATAYFITEAMDSTSTRVVWGLDGNMPYPLNLMLAVMDMEEMGGKDLEGGLKNLKTVLEQ